LPDALRNAIDAAFADAAARKPATSAGLVASFLHPADALIKKTAVCLVAADDVDLLVTAKNFLGACYGHTPSGDTCPKFGALQCAEVSGPVDSATVDKEKVAEAVCKNQIGGGCGRFGGVYTVIRSDGSPTKAEIGVSPKGTCESHWGSEDKTNESNPFTLNGDGTVTTEGSRWTVVGDDPFRLVGSSESIEFIRVKTTTGDVPGDGKSACIPDPEHDYFCAARLGPSNIGGAGIWSCKRMANGGPLDGICTYESVTQVSDTPKKGDTCDGVCGPLLVCIEGKCLDEDEWSTTACK
jgi:hypothetical protein